MAVVACQDQPTKGDQAALAGPDNEKHSSKSFPTAHLLLQVIPAAACATPLPLFLIQEPTGEGWSIIVLKTMFPEVNVHTITSFTSHSTLKCETLSVNYING